MKSKILNGLGLAAISVVSSCATVFSPTGVEDGLEVSEPIAIPVPRVVSLRHPEDFTISRLEELFAEKATPLWTKETYEQCARPIQEIQSKADNRAEVEAGVRELVHQDPPRYHWCFYGTLLDLEHGLAGESFILEKQSMVLRAFKVLAPISKAFLTENSDSRYYRYSIRRYQELTERVFFRKLEVLPEVTEKLVNLHHWPAQPEQRAPAGVAEEPSFLKKKGVVAPQALEAPSTDDPWKELDRYPSVEE